MYYTNGITGALQDMGDMFVGKTLIVDLSTGRLQAPDGPLFFEITASSPGDGVMTFSTTNPQGTSTIVDVSSAMGNSTEIQFARVFMLDNKPRDDGLAPFQLLLPSQIASGICRALIS